MDTGYGATKDSRQAVALGLERTVAGGLCKDLSFNSGIITAPYLHIMPFTWTHRSSSKPSTIEALSQLLITTLGPDKGHAIASVTNQNATVDIMRREPGRTRIAGGITTSIHIWVAAKKNCSIVSPASIGFRKRFLKTLVLYVAVAIAGRQPMF